MISSKKGFEISLEAAIKLVFGLVIIVFITWLGAKFFFIFSDEQDQEAAMNNFNRLIAEIESLKGEPFAYNEQPLDFFLPDSFILVGFDFEGLVKIPGCSKEPCTYGIVNAPTESQCTDEKIVRPEICHEKSCICLYKDVTGDDFEGGSKNILCHKFDENIIFLTHLDGIEGTFGGGKSLIEPDYPNYKGEKEYEFLVFYGSGCDVVYDSGVVSLFIDRYEKEGATYLYITTNQDIAKLRRERIGKEPSPEEEVCCYEKNRYFKAERRSCAEIKENCDLLACNGCWECDNERMETAIRSGFSLICEEEIPPGEQVCCSAIEGYSVTTNQQCASKGGEVIECGDLNLCKDFGCDKAAFEEWARAQAGEG